MCVCISETIINSSFPIAKNGFREKKSWSSELTTK